MNDTTATEIGAAGTLRFSFVGGGSLPLRAWTVVVGLLLALLARKAEAHEHHTGILPGLSLRNGDWLAADALGILELGASESGTPIAGTARVELGVGGAAAGIGLAAGSLPNSCNIGAMFNVEGRIARMYGPTTWRSTTYAGPQLSFSIMFLKASLAWMFDVHEATDNRLQVGLGVGF